MSESEATVMRIDAHREGTGEGTRALPKPRGSTGPYEAFVQAVADEGGFSPAAAEEAIVAVITTLEALLSFTEVHELEAELPAGLREVLHGEPIVDLPEMDEKELFGRVGARLGVCRHDAERIARVVLRTLRSSLSRIEVEHVEAQLSPGLRALWRSGPIEAS